MATITPEELFDNYHPVGTCIMSDHYVAILTIQSEPDEDSEDEEFYEDYGYKVKIIVYNLALEPNKQWGGLTLKPGLSSPLIVHTEQDEFLITDKTRSVFYAGVGPNKQFEEDIDPNISARDVTNIEGVIFGAAVGRTLYVRKGPNDWEMIDDAYDWPGADKVNKGFRAIDGFSLSDIYAAGADRDVWHFNYHTREWRPIDIGCFGKFECSTVCCAEDGNVYIGGRFGMIARGRGDNWESKKLDINSDIKKIVSYQGKIFIGTETFTYVLNDDLTAQLYHWNDEIVFTGGHMMYTAHGMMIVANYFGQVALHDGKKWQNLYGCETLNPIEQADADEDYNQAMDELGEALAKFNKEFDAQNKSE